ncbi:hypothetical protein C8Q77DRAFT_244440 [Trametes polyzona]|nr:hypothetical protein C8Q77DRAFT_244440 [Trametes polyzona]
MHSARGGEETRYGAHRGNVCDGVRDAHPALNLLELVSSRRRKARKKPACAPRSERVTSAALSTPAPGNVRRVLELRGQLLRPRGSTKRLTEIYSPPASSLDNHCALSSSTGIWHAARCTLPPPSLLACACRSPAACPHLADEQGTNIRRLSRVSEAVDEHMAPLPPLCGLEASVGTRTPTADISGRTGGGVVGPPRRTWIMHTYIRTSGDLEGRACFFVDTGGLGARGPGADREVSVGKGSIEPNEETKENPCPTVRGPAPPSQPSDHPSSTDATDRVARRAASAL